MNPGEEARNVLMIWGYRGWGGAQIYFLSIIRNAPPGWRFKLLIPFGADPDLLSLFEAHNVEIEYLQNSFDPEVADSIGSKIRRQWRRIRSEIEIYRRTMRNAYTSTIVHIEIAPWQSWMLLFYLSLRVQTIVTVHNALSHDQPAWRDLIWRWRLNFLMRLRRFQVFAANQNAIDSLRKFIRPSFWPKITLTRAAIDPDEIDEVLAASADRDLILAAHAIPSDRFIVVCMGQFIDRKGRWVFLDSARQTWTADNSLFFVWVAPEAPSRVDQARLDGYIGHEYFRFIVSSTLGPTRKNVLGFIRNADIFVLPSLWEGLPISVIEAMALGVPTISTNVNAIPEAIVHGETGLLVEPGDINGLTDVILLLRLDARLRSRLSEQGRVAAVEKFDERETAAIVFDRYESALSP